MKRLFIVLGFILFTVTSSGDDSIFFIVRMEPSIMLILDTSSSMTQDITSWDADKTWGDGSEDYRGMDMNGDSLSNDSRIYAAKEGIRHIVELFKYCRFGLMTFDQDCWWGMDESYSYRSYPYGWSDVQDIWWHGGCGVGVIKVPIGDPTTAHNDSIIRWIDHKSNFENIEDGDHEIRANGMTPIGGALQAARDHFQHDIIPNDAARACRCYYIILITDGAESCGGSPRDEAAELRHTLVDGVEYDIQTYVIAVSASPGNKQDCDMIALYGGTQTAQPAYEFAELDSAFMFVLEDIQERSFAFSAPEVPAVRSKYYDKLYLGSFIPSHDSFWRGFLKCYQLAANGTIPVDSLGIPLQYPLWEAGEVLKGKSSFNRDIYTEMNGQLVSFTSSDVLAGDLGIESENLESFIRWVRGDNGKDWKLGDIYHSWPVVVGPPSPVYYDGGYDQFQQNNEHRDKTIFVGSNDGMLHAFDAGNYIAEGDSFSAGTGQEVWAFIPNDLLGRLKDMKHVHGYYVDGSPKVVDAWLPSTDTDTTKDADEWRTVLICGERQGGNRYFALDVTNTRSPSFLWSFTDEHTGETWSQPAIGKVKLSAGGTEIERWVAVFGGGFSEDSVGSRGRAVYVVDIRNGNTIREFSSASMTHSFPSAPRLVDTDFDNFVDRIYIGDTGGRVWRIDISSTSPNQWKGDVIFAAPQGNAIYYPPAASAFEDNREKLWLFFGTGDRNEPRDTTYNSRFYGIIDDGQINPYTEDDLGDVTTVGEPSSKGWYINFVDQSGNHKGEKSLSQCEVFAGIVYFTTYQPVHGDPCARDGIARYYQVKYTTGNAVEGERFERIGTSLPTAPQITVSPEGNFVITVSTSRGKLLTESFDAPIPFREMIYWREVMAGGYQ